MGHTCVCVCVCACAYMGVRVRTCMSVSSVCECEVRRGGGGGGAFRISGFQDGPQGACVTRKHLPFPLQGQADPGRMLGVTSPHCGAPLTQPALVPCGSGHAAPGEARLQFSYYEVIAPASRGGHVGHPGTCQPSFTDGEAVSASSAWALAVGRRCP